MADIERKTIFSDNDDGREPLTHRRLLTRNAIINLMGNLVPLPVAVVTIPILVEALGTDRFGLLTLSWIFVGYFSFLDLGLGRALTQIVARKIGEGNEGEIPDLAWTALSLMVGLGIIAAMITGVFSGILISRLLNIPKQLEPEALKATWVLCVSIPFIISTAGLRGMLEAKQQFGKINAVGIPMKLFTFLGPVLVIVYSTDLFYVTGILVVARVVAWYIHYRMVWSVFPGFSGIPRITKSYIGPLFRLGGWMTMGNIIGPMMLYLDRFLIGCLISVSAVTYYATPYEVITKIFLITGAIGGVMFPAFSTSFAKSAVQTRQLYATALKWLTMLLVPIHLAMVLFAKEGIALWLGVEFAQQAFRVAQLLAIGVLILGMENIPFALIQALGRPDIPAKLNLLELPVYLVLFWYLTDTFGLVGSALAWVIRAVVDAGMLLFFANRLLETPSSAFIKQILRMMGLICLLIFSMYSWSPWVKLGGYAMILITFFIVAWSYLLDDSEKLFIEKHLATWWHRPKTHKNGYPN